MAKTSKKTATVDVKRPAAKAAKRPAAKALAVTQARKTDTPRAGSGLELAVKAILRSKAGLTRDEVQAKCGLRRKFSRWDFERLASQYGHKLVVGENKDGRALYRFA